MKVILLFLYFNLFFAVACYAQKNDPADSSVTINKPVTPQTYLPLIIYPALDMRSGVESISTLHRGLVFGENKLLSLIFNPSPNEDSGWPARLAKYILIDLPIDLFPLAIMHEYYGHGSRLREFGYSGMQYHFNYPFPYGLGKNWTRVGNSNNYMGPQECLAMFSGGLEAEMLINRNIGLQWMAKKEIDYREADQYFWCIWDSYMYIQGMDDNILNFQNGGDPRNYLIYLNRYNGYTDLKSLRMTVGDLKSKTKLILANPFFYLSIYSICKTIFWDGDESAKLPTIHFGELNYLPNFRAGLTPFGIEYHLENYFRLNEIVSLVDIGYGDQTFYNSWGNIGFLVRNIYRKDELTFDLHCNLWKQPGISFGAENTEVRGNGIGGAFSIRGYYEMPNFRLPISAILELGYKSVGFIEGYNLDASPIIMIGLAFRN